MKNLIGKKVRGFKFEGRRGYHYSPKMDEYIGQVGVIDEYDNVVSYYRVQFKDNWFYYPAELIEQHIVEDEPKTNKEEPLPQAVQYINPNGDIMNAIVEAYFNGTSLPQIKESIRQAYAAIEAGVNAQLVEVKEERGKL